MSNLPESSVLKDALETYSTTVAALSATKKSNPPLTDLDTWFHGEFRDTLNGTDKPTVSPEQLRKRGKHRPKLEALAQQNSAKDIAGVLDRAVGALHNEGKSKGSRSLKDVVRGAIAAVAELKGIGPATASALLSVCDDRIPFMSDEAMDLLGLGTPKYTLPFYMKFWECVTETVEGLNAEEKGDSWTPYTLEKALWSYKIGQRLGLEQSPKRGLKRKGDGGSPDEDGTGASHEVREEVGSKQISRSSPKRKWDTTELDGGGTDGSGSGTEVDSDHESEEEKTTVLNAYVGIASDC
ncbi:hypothetical protein HDV00_006469 [Rhizophlyctis rosea]|nr:hypothetical protein HDV00_006469 [Rhizophlyctis rosea]